MIDDKIYGMIMGGETVRIETTGTEESAMKLRTWLLQFGRTVSVNEYPLQQGTRLTLWIGGLDYNRRALVAGALKSNSLSFKFTNGDTS